MPCTDFGDQGNNHVVNSARREIRSLLRSSGRGAESRFRTSLTALSWLLLDSKTFSHVLPDSSLPQAFHGLYAADGYYVLGKINRFNPVLASIGTEE